MAKLNSRTAPVSAGSRDLDTLEKIRWSLRQRLCEHMRRLIADLFDEVDDFLFSSVKPEELAEGSSQMKLVREFRNKKQLFEERFLASIDGALQATLVPHSGDQKVVARLADENSTGSAYERMEVDLALERMQRKAFKHYAGRIRELGDTGRQSLNESSDRVIPENRDILIKSSLRALAIAQQVFRVSLGSRLLFLKLFEKHFLLNMDQLYQEVVSIINNKDNEKFVDKLYASSTSIHRRRSRSQISGIQQDGNGGAGVEPLSVSRRIADSVSELIEGWCGQSGLPEFVDTMLRQDWQNVMFLMGLNKGLQTREWCEARETVELLLALLGGNSSSDRGPDHADQVMTRLRQGFELAQSDPEDQQTFFAALRQHLKDNPAALPAATVGQDAGGQERAPVSSFAAVSEAGRKILDCNDLDDFIALLSDDQQQSLAEVEEEAISMDYYLNMVDAMADGAVAYLQQSGAGDKCRIHKSTSIVDSYQVLNESGRVLLTRGRVGLAVSLRAGEIRLEGQEDFRSSHSVAQLAGSGAVQPYSQPTTH